MVENSMSHHKFANLAEIFAGDLSSKLMENVVSLDFESLRCNCNAASKVDGKCIYGGRCRERIVVYKVNCTQCKCFYIGNTSRILKQRINEHMDDVRYQVKKGKLSDSFAAHFSQHFKEKSKVKRREVRQLLNVEVLWKGNPICCTKTFGKNSCQLCMKERLSILNNLKNNPKETINSNSEIFGACRHRPKFHRYIPRHLYHTDDGNKPRKGRASKKKVNKNKHGKLSSKLLETEYCSEVSSVVNGRLA